MEEHKSRFQDSWYISLVSFVVLLFYFIFFGLTGIRFVIGLFLLFFLPFYLILDNFDLTKSEKIVFAFFVGIGIYSTIAYYIGLLVDLKISIVITFLLLIGINFLIKRFIKAKELKGKSLNSINN